LLWFRMLMPCCQPTTMCKYRGREAATISVYIARLFELPTPLGSRMHSTLCKLAAVLYGCHTLHTDHGVVGSAGRGRTWETNAIQGVMECTTGHSQSGAELDLADALEVCHVALSRRSTMPLCHVTSLYHSVTSRHSIMPLCHVTSPYLPLCHVTPLTMPLCHVTSLYHANLHVTLSHHFVLHCSLACHS
jgi:hypothetical protein